MTNRLKSLFIILTLSLSLNLILSQKEVGPKPSNFCTPDAWTDISTLKSNLAGGYIAKESVFDDQGQIKYISLTPNDAISIKTTGTIWTSQTVDVSNGFEATFSMTVKQLRCGECIKANSMASKCTVKSCRGGSGFAFVLQDQGTNVGGPSGPGIGYGNIPGALAIEFDAQADKVSPYNDPANLYERHISLIQSPPPINGVLQKSGANEVNSLARNEDESVFNFMGEMNTQTPNFETTFDVKIEYLNEMFRVSINKVTQLGYYIPTPINKWFPNGKVYLGITAANAVTTKEPSSYYRVNNLKIRTPVAKGSTITVQLENPGIVFKTVEIFNVIVQMKDKCGKYLNAVLDQDISENIAFVKENSPSCEMKNVLFGSNNDFAKIGIQCSSVGTHNLLFTSQKNDLSPIPVTIKGGDLTFAKLIFQKSTLSIDETLFATFVAYDSLNNEVFVTEADVRANVILNYPDSRNTNNNYAITKSKDGRFQIEIKTDLIGTYSIKNNIFKKDKADGVYDFNFLVGAIVPEKSEAKILKGAIEAANLGTWEALSGAILPAGTSATVLVVYRDRVGNIVPSGFIDLNKAKTLKYIDGKDRSVIFEENVQKNDPAMTKGDLNLYGIQVLKKKGKYEYKFFYDNKPIKCPNCIFQIDPLAAEFTSSGLYQYSLANKGYDLTASDNFTITKPQSFNFKMVLRDIYENIVEGPDANGYVGTLSENSKTSKMTPLNLIISNVEEGLLLEIGSNDIEFFNNLVGTNGYDYVIQVVEKSSKKAKPWPLKIVSDGSDSDADNCPVNIPQSVLLFQTPIPDKGGNAIITAGSASRILLTLKSLCGKRFNNWVNENDIVLKWATPLNLEKGESSAPVKKADKRGTYFIDFTPTVAININTISVTILKAPVVKGAKYKVNPAPAKYGIIDQASIKSENNLIDGTVNKPYSFVFSLFDAYGNKFTGDILNLGLILNSQENKDVQTAIVTTQTAPGVFNCLVTPTFPGKYSVESSFISNAKGAPNSYFVYFRRGEPSATNSLATLVEDVSLGKVAGSVLTFKIISKDESGLVLSKDEVVKALPKFKANLKEPGLDAFTAIELTNVNENGEILASVTVTRAGYNLFSATLDGVSLNCAVCQVQVFAAEIDFTKISLSTIDSSEETRLDLSSVLSIDNIKKDPIFVMRFWDKYNNPQEPTDAMTYSGQIVVPNGAKSKYVFQSVTWTSIRKTIKFSLSDKDYPFFKSELANANCQATFSAVDKKLSKNQDLKFKVILKGLGNEDDIYSNDEIDPNQCIINPLSQNFVAGIFVQMSVELRTKSGKLYNHPLTFGFYSEDSLKSSFKLQVDLDGNEIAPGITNGKQKGTYVFQFTSYKSYIDGTDLVISYANPLNLTQLIPIPKKVRLTVSPSTFAYLLVDDESVFSDSKAGEVKKASPIPFDKFGNIIPKVSQTALNIQIKSSSGEVITPSLSQGADARVVITYTPLKAGVITITSLKFRNSEKQTVEKYTHSVSAAAVSGSRSIASLDVDTINAGATILWRIYPRDAYDNPIDCKPADAKIFTSTKQSPDSVNAALVGEPLIKDEDVDYFYWSVTLTQAGNHEFKAFAGKDLIPSSKYRATVLPIDADFTQTTLGLYNSKNSVYEAYNDLYFDQDIAGQPDFKALFRDRYGNTVNNLPAGWSLGLYLTNKELGEKNGIIFCRETDSITFRMCKDNKLQPTLVSPSKRWADLLVPKNYTLELTNNNVKHSPFKLFLRGNATEDDASNLPIEVQNTILTPDTITTVANVATTFQIFIMTTNPNLRRNEWFENPSETIKLSFASDSALISYQIAYGDKKGIYKATVTSNIAYVFNPNKITVSIGGVLVNNKAVKLFVNPGDPDAIFPFDKNATRVLSEVSNLAVDDFFSRFFIGRDKWDNVVDLNDNTVNVNSILSGPNGEQISHTRSFPQDSELVLIEFQPKYPGKYTIDFNGKNKYSFTVSQGAFDVTKSSATLSPATLLAGQAVTITLTPRDRWGNNLSLKDLSRFQYFVHGPKEPEDSYTIGTNQGAIVNGSSVVFTQIVTVKGFYKFRVSIDNVPVSMSLTRVQVNPAEVSLPNCIVKYLDDATNKYVLAQKDFPIKEDNMKYDASYMLYLADQYDNLYDVFPAEYNDDFNVILYGNDYDIKKPIKFVSSDIQGNGLFITVNPEDKIRYQNGIFETTPYSLQITFLETKAKVIYQVQLLGEGNGDNDAEIEKPIDISKTYLSKTKLNFVAGSSEDFLIELRTESGKRKADIGIPSFKFNFKQNDSLSDGNFSATFIKGDLRGRFIVTVTGFKANDLTGPTLLTILVNSLQVPKNVEVTVTPGALHHVDIIQTIFTVTADNDYSFQIIPRDVYNNIPNAKASDINLVVSFPAGSVGVKEVKNSIDYTTNYLTYTVKSRYVGEYVISSQFLKGVYKFKVTPGIPSALNTFVTVSSLVNRAGDAYTVTISPFDAYNNRIEPLSGDLGLICLKAITVSTIHGGSGPLSQAVKINGINLETSFTYTLVGSVNIVVLVNDKAAVCATCQVKYIPGPIALDHTKFYESRPSGVVNATKNVDIQKGVYDFSVVAAIFDKYDNAIEKLEDNEAFSSEFSGNNMEVMPFVVNKDQESSNLLQIVLEQTNSAAFARLVVSDNYDLVLNYLVDGRKKDSIHLRVDLNGEKDDGGNGPFVVENTVITPVEVVLTAGIWKKFTVELRTSENKRYVGLFNIQQLDAKETDNSKGTEKLKFDLGYGAIKGVFTVGLFTTKTLNEGEFKTVQVSIDSKVLKQTVKVTVEPNSPDMSKTIVVQPLPFDLYSGVPNEIKLKIFDNYGNPFASSALAQRITANTLEGKATFLATTYNSKNFEYSIQVTANYPPRIVTVQLFYRSSEKFVFPILLTPFLSQILTTLAPEKTELTGEKLPGVQIGNDFSFFILLKDKNGYCYEPTRTLSVIISGPYANSGAGERKAPQFVLEALPISPSEDKSEKLIVNGYDCNKYYKVISYTNQIQIAGYYQIEVFDKGVSAPYISQRTSLMTTGQVNFLKSLISIVNVPNTNPDLLTLKVNQQFTVKIQLRDNFKNPVADNSKYQVQLDFNQDEISKDQYTIAVRSSVSAIEFDIKVRKLGVLPVGLLTLNQKTYSWTQVDRFNFPANIEIIPGDCSTSQTNIANAPLIGGSVSVGAKANFIITCLDEFKNQVKRGGDQFIVTITTTDSALISTTVTDKGTGDYLVEFSTGIAGKYNVLIKLNGKNYGTGFSFEVKGSKCPADKPFICYGTEKCVAAYKECGYASLNCPSNDRPFNCLVSGVQSCVRTQAECDCQTEDFIKCASSSKCVNLFDADNVCATAGQNPSLLLCPAEAPVQCLDGSCRVDIDQCPSQYGCPPEFKLCPGMTCSHKDSPCPERSADSCPFEAFYRCEDYNCRPTSAVCATGLTCPRAGQIICPDGKCADSEIFCAAPSVCGEGTIQCMGGSCASDYSNCPTGITCGPGLALCIDGSCQKTCTTGPKINRLLRMIQENATSTTCGGRKTCPETGECVEDESLCPTKVTCASNEVKCSAFTCANDLKHCLPRKCPENQVLCWDNSCADSLTECPTRITCPSKFKVLCSDGSCVEDIKQCKPSQSCPPNRQVKCGTGECRRSHEECPTQKTCPKDYPIKCQVGNCVKDKENCQIVVENSQCAENEVRCGDGSCATTRARCSTMPTCLKGQVRCWDNTCSDNLEECATYRECSYDKSVQCADGSCAANIKECPTNIICPKDLPILCEDGNCRGAISDCVSYTTCEIGQTRCSDGSCTVGKCGTSITCTENTPYKCYDGTCRKFSNDCPEMPSCPQSSPVLCHDGSCVEFRALCPVSPECPLDQPVRCPDESCRRVLSECPVMNTVCPVGKVLCENGACMSSYKACPEIECPASSPFRCDDGFCVFDLKRCDLPNGCPYNLPYKCANGQCTNNSTACKSFNCSVGLTLCPDGSCQLSPKACPLSNGCPSELPKRCSNGECLASNKHCPISRCPKDQPFKCYNGICVKSKKDCSVLFTPEPDSHCVFNTDGNNVYCADGRCVSNLEECRPVFRCQPGQHRCGDGSCKFDLNKCPLVEQCPAPNNLRCSNGACVSSLDDCILENGCSKSLPERCQNSGICVKDSFSCEDAEKKAINHAGCSFLNPLRCENGACVQFIENCTVVIVSEPVCNKTSEKPYLCPDGTCEESLIKCGTNCKNGQITCANGKCAATRLDCLNSRGCPYRAPFKCADGSCVKVHESHKCGRKIQCQEQTPYLCADGECESDRLQCRVVLPCPSEQPYLCPDKTCSKSHDTCNQICPPTAQITCEDGKCVDSIDDCKSINPCSAETPFKCFNADCVKSPGLCVDVEVRTGKKTTRFLLETTGDVDPSCTTEAPRLCSDGGCRTECPVVSSCSDPLKGYRCQSGICVANKTECEAKLEDCVAGTTRCEDGYCRVKCLPFDGCPLSAPFQCPNGQCGQDESSCANPDGLILCANNNLVNSVSKCSSPIKTLKSENFRLTISSYKSSKATFLNDDVTSYKFGAIYVPSGAFKNGSESSPYSILEIKPVAQSLVKGSQINEFSVPSKVEKQFPNADLSNFNLNDLIRSPIVNVTVEDKNDTYRFPVVLGLGTDLIVNSSHNDYCLARLNELKWTCGPRKLLSDKGELNFDLLNFEILQNGVYAIIYDPQLEVVQNNESSSSSDWWDDNKGTVLGTLFGFIGAILILGIVLYLYIRLSKKGGNQERLLSENDNSESDKKKLEQTLQQLSEKEKIIQAANQECNNTKEQNIVLTHKLESLANELNNLKSQMAQNQE